MADKKGKGKLYHEDDDDGADKGDQRTSSSPGATNSFDNPLESPGTTRESSEDTNEGGVHDVAGELDSDAEKEGNQPIIGLSKRKTTKRVFVSSVQTWQEGDVPATVGEDVTKVEKNIPTSSTSVLAGLSSDDLSSAQMQYELYRREAGSLENFLRMQQQAYSNHKVLPSSSAEMVLTNPRDSSDRARESVRMADKKGKGKLYPEDDEDDGADKGDKRTSSSPGVTNSYYDPRDSPDRARESSEDTNEGGVHDSASDLDSSPSVLSGLSSDDLSNAQMQYELYRREAGSLENFLRMQQQAYSNHKVLPSSSAEMVLNNQDLLNLILNYLPLKQGVMSMSINDMWYSVVSETLRTSEILWVGYCFRGGSESFRFMTFHSDDSFRNPTIPLLEDYGTSVVNASNGLFLLHSGKKDLYTVFNVFTRESLQLPREPIPSAILYVEKSVCTSILYDRTRSVHFKLVSLYNCTSDDAPSYEMMIFRSENWRWERIRIPRRGSELKLMAFCEGVVHRLTSDKFHLQLQMDSEVLTCNPSPEGLGNIIIEYVLHLGECAGKVFMVYLEPGSEDMYILQLRNSRWLVVSSVSPKESKESSSFISGDLEQSESWEQLVASRKFKVLGLVKHGEWGGLCVLIAVPNRIISYSISKQSFTIADDFTEYEPRRGNFQDRVQCHAITPRVQPRDVADPGL